MNLSGFAGQTIKLRFLLRSDGSVQKDGWYVDNIKISVYNTVIPVELTSFTAIAVGNNIEISWSTATETNNRGFEIQRTLTPTSERKSLWESVGFVTGKGTTTEPQNYSFVDKNLQAGTYLYRLKQIDFDGIFEYSNEIEVEIVSPNEFALEQNYPNPFNPSTSIKYALKSRQFVQIKIYDVLGNEVTTLVNEEKQPGVYEVEFNASELSSGTYIYKLTAGNFSAIRKMLLLK
jgi:hypothetical protein